MLVAASGFYRNVVRQHFEELHLLGREAHGMEHLMVFLGLFPCRKEPLLVRGEEAIRRLRPPVDPHRSGPPRLH